MTLDTSLDTPKLTTLGQFIKDTATAQGLSMRALAKKANITYAGLYKLSKAPNHKPNLDTLIALSQALGQPLDTLIEAAGYKPTLIAA